jgi:hypothetical protein
VGTRIARGPARIFIPELGPRSRALPLDVGEPLNWAVAAYRLLQTRFDVRAHPRAPSPSSVSDPESLTGFRFFLRLRDDRLLRGGPSATSRKNPGEGVNLRPTGEAGHGNSLGPTEPSEGLAHCVSSPPRVPAEHHLVANPLPRKTWSVLRRAAPGRSF